MTVFCITYARHAYVIAIDGDVAGRLSRVEGERVDYPLPGRRVKRCGVSTVVPYPAPRHDERFGLVVEAEPYRLVVRPNVERGCATGHSGSVLLTPATPSYSASGMMLCVE